MALNSCWIIRNTLNRDGWSFEDVDFIFKHSTILIPEYKKVRRELGDSGRWKSKWILLHKKY